jgi:putative transposase
MPVTRPNQVWSTDITPIRLARGFATLVAIIDWDEDVYLKGYASMGELMLGLTEYFAFTNGERPHQSLGHKTPDVVYRTAIGGGALIVDKFPQPQRQQAKLKQRRGSAVQLRVKSNVQVKLTAVLS